MEKEIIKILLTEFNEKPIAYHRIYSKITGRAITGLILSQLVYWAATKNWGENYKTDEELAEEVGASIKEVRNAKKKLKEFYFIKIEVRGIPARTYYTIDPIKLAEVVKLVCPKGINLISQKGQTSLAERDKHSITETTQRLHTDRENEFLDEASPQLESVPTDEFGNPLSRRKPRKTTAKTVPPLYRLFGDILYEGQFPGFWLAKLDFRESAERLEEERGIESITNALEFYKRNRTNRFCPQVVNPSALEEKWDALVLFRNKQKQNDR